MYHMGESLRVLASIYMFRYRQELCLILCNNNRKNYVQAQTWSRHEGRNIASILYPCPNSTGNRFYGWRRPGRGIKNFIIP